MGWVVTLAGKNYNAVMGASPVFFLLALILMMGVRKGESQPASA
jgi:hypothetical protein